MWSTSNSEAERAEAVGGGDGHVCDLLVTPPGVHGHGGVLHPEPGEVPYIQKVMFMIDITAAWLGY